MSFIFPIIIHKLKVNIKGVPLKYSVFHNGQGKMAYFSQRMNYISTHLHQLMKFDFTCWEGTQENRNTKENLLIAYEQWTFNIYISFLFFFKKCVTLQAFNKCLLNEQINVNPKSMIPNIFPTLTPWKDISSSHQQQWVDERFSTRE